MILMKTLAPQCKAALSDIDQSVTDSNHPAESLKQRQNKSDKNYRKGSIVKWPIRYRIMAIPFVHMKIFQSDKSPPGRIVKKC